MSGSLEATSRSSSTLVKQIKMHFMVSSQLLNNLNWGNLTGVN